MLDKYNITSTSALEAVDEIPADEKDYRKCLFMCFTLCSHSIQRADQHISNIQTPSFLPTRMHPV